MIAFINMLSDSTDPQIEAPVGRQDVGLEELNYSSLYDIPSSIRNAFEAESSQPLLEVNDDDVIYAKNLLIRFIQSDEGKDEFLSRVESAPSDWDRIKILFGLLNRFMARHTKPREENEIDKARNYRYLQEVISDQGAHTKCNVFNVAYIKLFPILCDLLGLVSLKKKISFSYDAWQLYNPLDTHQGDFNTFNHQFVTALIYPRPNLSTPVLMVLDPYWGTRSTMHDDLGEIEYTRFRLPAAMMQMAVKLFRYKHRNIAKYLVDFVRVFEVNQIHNFMTSAKNPTWLKLQMAGVALETSQFSYAWPSKAVFDRGGQPLVTLTSADKTLYEQVAADVNFAKWRDKYSEGLAEYAVEVIDVVKREIEGYRFRPNAALLDMLSFTNLGRVLTVYEPKLKELRIETQELLVTVRQLCLEIAVRVLVSGIEFSEREVAVLRRRGIIESVLSAMELGESVEVSSGQDSQSERQRAYLSIRAVITVVWMLSVADTLKIQSSFSQLKKQYRQYANYQIFIKEVKRAFSDLQDLSGGTSFLEEGQWQSSFSQVGNLLDSIN